ncbi:MAG: hypothetical protein K2Q01_11655, partial [Rickettsiales bacterium]|nr:hypothetical protein [Rickettsiales bacterium]
MPRSVANPYIPAAGVAAFLLMLWACRAYHYSGVHATLAAVLAYGGTILLLELFVLQVPAQAENGLRFSRLEFSGERVFFKIVGLAASLGWVAGLYWLFPEYHS